MSGYSAEDGAVVLETRRRRSRDERNAIVAESQKPGANISAIARRNGLAPSLLFRWRREAAVAGPRSGARIFLPVRLSATADTAAVSRDPGGLEIAVGRGVRVIVNERTDLALLKRVIEALG